MTWSAVFLRGVECREYYLGECATEEERLAKATALMERSELAGWRLFGFMEAE
jgi:hypothetical protein